jgi:hypothetical protein
VRLDHEYLGDARSREVRESADAPIAVLFVECLSLFVEVRDEEAPVATPEPRLDSLTAMRRK